MNIPEGYKLVPVNPTEIMQDFGCSNMPVDWESPFEAAKVYSAMIGAAPKAEILAYDEARERELFESAYPLDNGVTWRAEAGNEGRYCVWIDCNGGFWACVNAAFGFQQKWEVWSKCAKSRARSAE